MRSTFTPDEFADFIDKFADHVSAQARRLQSIAELYPQFDGEAASLIHCLHVFAMQARQLLGSRDASRQRGFVARYQSVADMIDRIIEKSDTLADTATYKEIRVRDLRAINPHTHAIVPASAEAVR